jgi:hypothetical protein
MIITLKANELATGSKGVKRKHLTLTLTKNLEVLKMLIIVWTFGSVLCCYIWWTVHTKLLFLNTGNPSNKG